MNIVNRLTLRHLKGNRKRTLVTLVGVIISTAMIMAVTTIGVSFMNLLQRQEISNNGEWHVIYHDAGPDELEVIRSDERTEKMLLSRNRGYALLEGNKNQYKPYLFIKEYSPEGYSHFPITLTSGRLPAAEGEIVISDEIAETAGLTFAAGDELTLETGQRLLLETASDEVQMELGQTDSLRRGDPEYFETLGSLETAAYTIVGTIARPEWEPAWAPGYTAIGFINPARIGAAETADALVILDKVNRSLFGHAEALAATLGIEEVGFNSELLRYYGVTKNDGLHSTLYGLTAIILAITVIGSVSLIYNAFAISVAERGRHLGMLSSVGATRKQKRNSVFFEGAFIGTIGIPIGIMAGIGGIAVTFTFINSMIRGALGLSESLRVTVTLPSLLAAVAVSLATIFISTWLPARRASRVSAIDAIRQSEEVKLSSRSVRTSPLVRRLFGLEAEIGLKNLKRNRRRYKATVFSIMISVLLFLTVSYFTLNLGKSLELSQNLANYDIQILLPRQDEQSSLMIGQIAARAEVGEHTVVQAHEAQSWLDREMLSDDVLKMLEDFGEELTDGRYPYHVSFYALDEASLTRYAAGIGADIDELTDPGRSKGILIETIKYEDGATGKKVEAEASKLVAGDRVTIYSYPSDNTDEQIEAGDIEILALTREIPMGVYTPGRGTLAIIVSEDTLSRLFPEDRSNWQGLYLNSSDPMATQYAIEAFEFSAASVYNIHQVRQQDEQMILLMSVFTYGFIALMTAICIANIMNTISTSIQLRKREFAMLKSVGMTPQGFTRMIRYESFFYGAKALLYGLPLSIVVMLLIYRALMNTFTFGFELPWSSIILAVAAVFIISGTAMLYAGSRVKKENIIDALKQESV